jgi:hypothetical protein
MLTPSDPLAACPAPPAVSAVDPPVNEKLAMMNP